MHRKITAALLAAPLIASFAVAAPPAVAADKYLTVVKANIPYKAGESGDRLWSPSPSCRRGCGFHRCSSWR